MHGAARFWRALVLPVIRFKLQAERYGAPPFCRHVGTAKVKSVSHRQPMHRQKEDFCECESNTYHQHSEWSHSSQSYAWCFPSLTGTVFGWSHSHSSLSCTSTRDPRDMHHALRSKGEFRQSAETRTRNKKKRIIMHARWSCWTVLDFRGFRKGTKRNKKRPSWVRASSPRKILYLDQRELSKLN